VSGTRRNKTQPLLSKETAVCGGLPPNKQEMTTQCTEYCNTQKYNMPWDMTRGHVSRLERSWKDFWRGKSI
jgi:hypothetical protein